MAGAVPSIQHLYDVFFYHRREAGGDWHIGTGEIWYQITLSDWFRFSDVAWLRAPWICWLATNGSLLLEGSFAFLVWTRLRLPLVLLLIGLHVAITVLFCNALFFFNLAAITGLCVFFKTNDFGRVRSAREQKATDAADTINSDPSLAS